MYSNIEDNDLWFLLQNIRIDVINFFKKRFSCTTVIKKVDDEAAFSYDFLSKIKIDFNLEIMQKSLFH